MNLAQPANLGAFIGDVAVLVKLIHLAAQLRQNTRQVAEQNRAQRLTSLNEVGRHFTGFRQSVVNGRISRSFLERC